MKLSKAQAEVMEKAKNDIDFARTHTVREWAIKKEYGTEEKIERLIANAEEYRCTQEEMKKYIEEKITSRVENYRQYYEDNRNAIVLTYANSRTLKKLEEMGLIEIIYDSNGTSFGIDTVKVLNY